MKDMKRAIRRHHYSRIKNNRYHDLKQWEGNWYGVTEEYFIDRSRRMATTAQVCSCLGCGNPRKHLNELTLQEQRNELAFEEGLDLYFHSRANVGS